MTKPRLSDHRDEHGGTVSGSYEGQRWSAQYNNDSDLAAGPETGTFTDGDGATWTAADLGGPALRAVRYVDWHQRIQKLRPHEPGKPITSHSVRLAADPTYFGRDFARRGSGANGQQRDRFYCTFLGWLQEYTDADLELREPDEQVVVGGAEWGSAAVTWTDDIPDTREGSAAPESGGVGAKQRLRIHVPNVFTKLTLGEAYRDQDGQGFAYPGFGVETEGHIFMTARKDAANSTATLQAKGDFVIQSELERMLVGSKKQAVLASGGSNAYLIGGGGTVIAGGTAVPWSPLLDSDGTTPLPPAWKDNFTGIADDITRGWSIADAFVAGATGIYNGVKTAVGWSGSFWDAFSVAGLLLGNVGGAAVSGLGAAGVSTIGGTVIHGSGGVIIGSPHTTSIYSGTGLTLASVLGTTILSPAVGILGIHEVSVEAKNSVKISSMDEIAIASYTKIHVDTNRNATYGGRFINVGEHAVGSQPAERKWPTMRVDVSAKHGVEILADTGAVDVLGAMGAGRDAGRVRIGAPAHVSLASDKLVTVASGGDGVVKLVVHTGTEQIELKKDQIELKSDDSVVLLKKGDGVVMRRGSDGGVKATDSEVTVGWGSNTFVIDKNGAHKWNGRSLDLKGSSIKLG